MLIWPVEYDDYNEVHCTENLYFNLTQSELIEMDAMLPGGMEETFKLIREKNDVPALMTAFKTILLKAYGIKHADGKRFEKSKEISDAFEQSPAYDVLFMSLVQDNGEMSSKFIKGILPKTPSKPQAPSNTVENVAFGTPNNT